MTFFRDGRWRDARGIVHEASNQYRGDDLTNDAWFVRAFTACGSRFMLELALLPDATPVTCLECLSLPV